MAGVVVTGDLPRNLSRDGAAFLRPIAASGAPYLFERSLKLVSGAIETDRFLATVSREVLGSRASQALLDRFGAAAWPASVREAVETALVGCIAVHFGFEVGRGAIGHKIYCEYPAEPREDGLVYLAFKWRRDDPSYVVETRYSHLSLHRQAIAKTLGDLLGEDASAARIGIEIAALAARRSPDAELMLLRVDEANHPRRSFDLQIYDAGLRVSDAVYTLRGHAATLDLRPDQVCDALAPMSGARLGHVAAGLNRDAAPFVTLYFAPERR